MKKVELELERIKDIIKKYIENSQEKEILEKFLLGSSKFIRSRVSILYLLANNKKINNDILNILAIGEILHNASLLHDDVIDNASERRKEVTIAKQMTSNISILLGDYLISLAMENLLKSNNISILKNFINCAKNMSSAELKQLFLRNKIPTAQEYIYICEGKTANLFSAILQSCSIIKGMNECTAIKFAKLYGLNFQIANDMEKSSALVDKKNGIYTAQDILGIEKTNILLDNNKKEMKTIISSMPNNKYKKYLESLVENIC